MRTIRVLSVLVIIATLLPLAGCGGGGSKTLKIGVIAPMTGDVKTFGESTRNGVQMAVEEWNAKGGLLGKQIEIVLGDDKNDPAEATAAATKLIKQDKVKFIVGSVASKCSIPISDVANKNQVVMISPTSTNPKVTVADGVLKEYAFRACFIDPPQGSAMAKFATENLGIKTAAVFYDNGNDYVKGLAEFFKAAFEARGGKVTVYEAYAQTDTDFTALLTKVMAEPPDMLYIPDYYNMANLVNQQARAAGFKGILAGGDGWDSSDLDFQAADGGYFTNHYAADDPRSEVQNWVARYKAKYGTVPDALATLGYDAANLLLNAIKAANSEDPVKVKDALAATAGFPTVSGTISFDENHNPINKDIVVLQVKEGKFVHVATLKPE
ncbi:MAG: ABC transporter substrate-binding protein [Anaerolineae bacterium]|nr:ABC transporter substrate-binding protein [Anaerolineae bacterium]